MIAAPSKALPTTVIRPTIRLDWRAYVGSAALSDLPVAAPASEIAADVATVYTKPNLDLATPASEPARVVAPPQRLATTVIALLLAARQSEIGVKD